MPDVVFHYTSGQAAQEITISGRFKVGLSGRIYFTEDTYSRGTDAACRLSITNKPVETVLVVAREYIPDLSDVGFVESILGPDGEEARPGEAPSDGQARRCA